MQALSWLLLMGFVSLGICFKRRLTFSIPRTPLFAVNHKAQKRYTGDSKQSKKRPTTRSVKPLAPSASEVMQSLRTSRQTPDIMELVESSLFIANRQNDWALVMEVYSFSTLVDTTLTPQFYEKVITIMTRCGGHGHLYQIISDALAHGITPKESTITYVFLELSRMGELPVMLALLDSLSRFKVKGEMVVSNEAYVLCSFVLPYFLVCGASASLLSTYCCMFAFSDTTWRLTIDPYPPQSINLNRHNPHIPSYNTGIWPC
jgi:hypothetical protein